MSIIESDWQGPLAEESRSDEVLATMMGEYGKQTNRRDARVR